MYWSSRNTTESTRPARGSASRCLTKRNGERKRSTSPTWFVTPAFSTVATMRSAIGAFTASGFSQKIALPRAAAFSTRRGCSEVQVVT